MLPVRAAAHYSIIPGLMLLTAAIVGLGVHLRSLDTRRRTAVTEARQTERLSIAAADLHDYIAHHVTGIHVQTQMARMLIADRPGEVDPILGQVEHAATEALAAMRRTVGIIRTHPDPAWPAGPLLAGDLNTLPELVTGFHLPTGTCAVPHHGSTMPENVPHEVQVAAYRVVQATSTGTPPTPPRSTSPSSSTATPSG